MVWVVKFDVDDDGVYEVTIAGAVIMSIMEELNGYETIRFTIPNDATNRGYVAVDVDFQILWDASSIYEGVCTGGNYAPGNIVCFGYNAVYQEMQKKSHTGVYDGVAADVVLAAICLSAGVSSNLIAAGFPGGVAPTLSVRFSRANCFDAALFVAASCIGDYYASGGDTFNIEKTRWTKTTAMATLSVSRRGIDRSKQRDLITVVGVDNDGVELVATYGPGTNEAVIRESRASDLATLTALAEDYYNQLNKESSGASIVVPITDGYDMYPGDNATINDAAYALAGDYRIWKITKSIGTVSLEVDKAELNIDRVIDDMRNLEDLGIYVLDISTLPAYLQPWNTDLIFEAYDDPGPGTVHNCVRWGAPHPLAANVHFSNGDDQEVLAGDSVTIHGAPLTDGSVYYFYFELGDNTMNITTNYQTATGAGAGLLATVEISTDATQNPGIQTYKSGGRTVISEDLGDGSVVNRVITASSIYGKDIATQPDVGEVAGNPGIRILGDNSEVVLAPTVIGDAIGGNFTSGIWGFTDGPIARTFWLDPVTGAIHVYGDGFYVIHKADGTVVGYVDGTTSAPGAVDTLMVRAANNMRALFEAGGYGVSFRSDTTPKRALFYGGRMIVDMSTERFVLPLYNGADPAAPETGESWFRPDLV